MLRKTIGYAVMVLLFPVLASAQEGQRLELGVLFTGSFLREIGTRDSGVGTDVAGAGGRVVFHALPFLDLESELSFLPGNAATSGNHLQGLFGAKAGRRWDRVGMFVKARPGFMHFTRDPFGVTRPGSGLVSHERASSTEPSLDLGGVLEYYTRKGLILRLDLGDTLIRYAPRTVRVSGALPAVAAGGFHTHNWQGSFGVGFRF